MEEDLPISVRKTPYERLPESSAEGEPTLLLPRHLGKRVSIDTIRRSERGRRNEAQGGIEALPYEVCTRAKPHTSIVVVADLAFSCWRTF